MAIAEHWTDVDLDLLTDRTRLDDALSALAALSAQLAATAPAPPRRDELVRLACAGARRVLSAPLCRFAAADEGGGAQADDLTATVTGAGTLVVAERARRPFTPQDQQLLDVIAQQLGLALARADLAERLTEEHLVRDLFDAVAEGREAQAEARARAAGHDLDRPHVVAILEPLDDAALAAWPDVAARVEARLRRVVPGALCDPGDERLRALLPLGATAATADLQRLDEELARLTREEGLAGGRSEPRGGLAGGARGLTEAACAAQVARATTPAGGARAYDDLGVYRYLAQLPAGHAPDERHAGAIAALAAYDARRRTELLQTLERHLGDRGALAATARALYIHTNTLRQRLDRIESLTGLDLATEDLLSLELALKLARLHGV
jgi:sugar diacid utilization regulator